MRRPMATYSGARSQTWRKSTLKLATASPIRRFAAIAHRTRPRRERRTGARYSPPPTPVKPERTPNGAPNRAPTTSPERRSATGPDGATKESRNGSRTFYFSGKTRRNPALENQQFVGDSKSNGRQSGP